MRFLVVSIPKSDILVIASFSSLSLFLVIIPNSRLEVRMMFGWNGGIGWGWDVDSFVGL